MEVGEDDGDLGARDHQDQEHQRQEPEHVVEAVLHSVFGCQHVSMSVSSRVGALWSVLEGSREVERRDYEGS